MRKKLNILILLYLLGSTILFSCSSAIENQIVVAADGSGDYKSIQEAINAVRSSEETTLIFIKSGIYKEKLVVPVDKENIHFVGEDAAKTIITWDDYSGKGDINTFTSFTMQILGNNICVENLTIENSEGMQGQAVALHVEGDGCSFKKCRILGNQDTVYASGKNSRQYFQECYIEGTTDFIFGSSTAVFQDCVILCKKNSYITAASTPKESEFGYVFMNCKIEAAPEISKVYLGRPWRDYANVVFLNCELGAHIRPEGWHNWSKPEREETAFYAEYQNRGLGADTSDRVVWSKQLTAKQAEKYTVENVLQLSKWEIK
ncbi:pectinesterase family protein [Labilibaculum euxinus]|uniref:Pectinesterase n=1 Tax=Labilibaculum euxinus TaxID=2686357 RepID=A0A7M4D536_9BACT|nr:pectinesterase family protein [Labilibaculum euxinus]MUP37765.1 pectin esterase [Labilibaculum euxinus]MVB06970.1 pectin esterase [Labilibaculum euxinus]